MLKKVNVDFMLHCELEESSASVSSLSAWESFSSTWQSTECVCIFNMLDIYNLRLFRPLFLQENVIICRTLKIIGNLIRILIVVCSSIKSTVCNIQILSWMLICWRSPGYTVTLLTLTMEILQVFMSAQICLDCLVTSFFFLFFFFFKVF